MRGAHVSRREILQGVAGSVAAAALSRTTSAQAQGTALSVRFVPKSFPPASGRVSSNNVNGLRMHVLEAGFETRIGPPLLLVHGFPELAYSWRKVMLPLAAAGFHVFAPDLRGYGRTSGTDVTFDDDLAPFRTLNEVRDMLALVSAFGYRSVAAVIGHDFGSPVSAWCAVVRPDVFRSVVLMSAPFGGPPALPFNTADAPRDRERAGGRHIYAALATLNPPRKHYQRYYSTREANDNMRKAPQGVHAFLRAYYHMKSADWKQNKPAPLKARTADEWAKLPRYYVMDLDKGMAETVAAEMPSPAQIAANRWLPDEDLRVYSRRVRQDRIPGRAAVATASVERAVTPRKLQLFAGRTIDLPSMFIGGKQRLGRLSEARRAGAHAEVGVHPDARRPSGGRRRTLGAAGAARSREHAVCWNSLETWN